MIINVRELSKLRDVIRMVSATVSEVGSRNVSTGGTDVSTTIGIRIRQTLGGQDGILVSNPAGEGGWY